MSSRSTTKHACLVDVERTEDGRATASTPDCYEEAQESEYHALKEFRRNKKAAETAQAEVKDAQDDARTAWDEVKDAQADAREARADAATATAEADAQKARADAATTRAETNAARADAATARAEALYNGQRQEKAAAAASPSAAKTKAALTAAASPPPPPPPPRAPALWVPVWKPDEEAVTEFRMGSVYRCVPSDGTTTYYYGASKKFLRLVRVRTLKQGGKRLTVGTPGDVTNGTIWSRTDATDMRVGEMRDFLTSKGLVLET
mgnify:CR=1 FL=1